MSYNINSQMEDYKILGSIKWKIIKYLVLSAELIL